MTSIAPLHITVTATFTAEPLSDALNFWMHTLQQDATLHFSPLNQVFQQLLDASSPVRRNTGINLVLIRFDDWCRVEDGLESGGNDGQPMRDRMQRNLADLVAALGTAVQGSVASYVVCVCPPSPFLADNPDYAFAALEQQLCTALAPIKGLSVISAQDIARAYPVDDYYDFHADKLGNIPYKPIYFDTLATVITRRVLALRTPPRKVLVLDCDNTLWRGVCGEDGLAALEVDAGRRYLQEKALQAHAQGMLICLCSKNNEADVWKTFDALPGMLLQKSHVIASRINWDSKSRNIQALADELQLATASFIFIDDNPVECAEVSAACPDVLSLCLPQASDEIAAFLDHVWALDAVASTAEDRQRSELYRQKIERERYRSETGSFERFVQGLELKIAIERIAPATPMPAKLTRAAQLTQRVNQFNFSGTRHTEAELGALLQDERMACFAVDVSDRFGDYGMVGLSVCRQDARELKLLNMLLSCRALGKGVEYRMLAALGEYALQCGLATLRIEFTPAERNQPARDFLAKVASAYEVADGERIYFNLPAEFAAQIAFVDYLQSAGQAPQVREQDEPVASLAHTSVGVIPFERIARELATPKKIHAAVLMHVQSSRAARAEFVAPRNDIERAIASIWQEVLDMEHIGVTDNFFQLGGESIKAIQILSRIREEFSIELPMSVLFEDRITVESLAQAVEFSLLGNADQDALAEELAAIENMSDEEIERLLQQSNG